MTSSSGAKQIVYLFGAGATQSEVNYLGAQPVNLLMRDSGSLEGVSTGILRRTRGRIPSMGAEESNVDIEKLISLFAASGSSRLVDLAEAMRRSYFEEICERLVFAGVVGAPDLATGLLQMHRDAKFCEKIESLSGILTTNHDGLLQVASQTVYGGLNLGFPFDADKSAFVDLQSAPPILQLHGSFTWTFALPTKVMPLDKDTKYTKKTLWIPPTVLKESRSYPFIKLAGLAYEVLVKRCDVLRVVGASLTQNDWNVLSLIFNAQRHRKLARLPEFRVELIMSHKGGLRVQEQCSYIKNIVPLGFLTEGKFDHFKEESVVLDDEMKNSFAYWLKEKIRYHKERGEFDAGAITATIAEILGEAA